jgi:hypothetical protein
MIKKMQENKYGAGDKTVTRSLRVFAGAGNEFRD